jgi:hypothetical protein
MRKKRLLLLMSCAKDFFTHCRSLKFDEKPNYELIKKLFKDLFHTKGYNKNFEYDWIT